MRYSEFIGKQLAELCLRRRFVISIDRDGSSACDQHRCFAVFPKPPATEEPVSCFFHLNSQAIGWCRPDAAAKHQHRIRLGDGFRSECCGLIFQLPQQGITHHRHRWHGNHQPTRDRERQAPAALTAADGDELQQQPQPQWVNQLW